MGAHVLPAVVAEDAQQPRQVGDSSVVDEHSSEQASDSVIGLQGQDGRVGFRDEVASGGSLGEDVAGENKQDVREISIFVCSARPRAQISDTTSACKQRVYSPEGEDEADFDAVWSEEMKGSENLRTSSLCLSEKGVPSSFVGGMTPERMSSTCVKGGAAAHASECFISE